jgi:PAS domain S-box-containing protein
MTNETPLSTPLNQKADNPALPSAELLIAAVEDLPWLVAFFLLKDGHLLYCNKTALQWLDPEQRSMSEETFLSDIMGIEYLDRLKDQMLPQANALGQWSGRCSLRDFWGSEFDVSATLQKQKKMKTGEEWICLQACKVNEGDSTSGTSSTSDREFLRALLNTLPENIYFKDTQSRFLRISANMTRHFGADNSNDVLGKTDFDVFEADHAKAAFETEQRIIRTGESILNLEEKETHTNGRVTWVSTSKFPLYDREGNIVGTFGISRDVTERKRAESEQKEMEVQILLSQKLESIGRLASGVAHEINTPAQFITDNTLFLKRALMPMISVLGAYKTLLQTVKSGGDPQLALEAIAKIERESRLDFLVSEIPQTLADTLEGLTRVTSIVRSLKEFSHPNKATKSPMNLNRAIETTVAVSKHEWKYVATVSTELDPELPAVPGVVDEINQVILNLVVNAAQAIEESMKVRKSMVMGKITIRSRKDGEFVLIEIQDTGAGIPDNVKARIFDPFFTTKEVGKGTGQGLAIARTVIVRNHGGTLECDSTPGVGTTFKIRLPINSNHTD